MLHSGIITNGDCLFHSVEYADNKMKLTGKNFNEKQLRDLRSTIATRLHKKGKDLISGVPWNEFRDGYTWSQNDVLAELAILKNKPIWVNKGNEAAVFFPTKSKIDKTLFIVCQNNVHFTTYTHQPKVTAELKQVFKQIFDNTEFKEIDNDIVIFYFPINKSKSKSKYSSNATEAKNKRVYKNKSMKLGLNSRSSFNPKEEQDKINRVHQEQNNFDYARQLQIKNNYNFARHLQNQK